MYRDKSRLVPIVLAIVVAIVAIIALVSLGRAVLNRNGSSQVVDDTASRALLTNEADRSVRMKVRGPIVADEDFRSYEVEISPIGRSMTVYGGYSKQVIEAERLVNNTQAYTEFIYALSRAGFTKEKVLKEEVDAEGACATGRFYTFQLLQAQSVIKEYWTSSCRGLTGSFGGDAVLIRNLFEKQIPKSRELLRGVKLTS